MVQKALDEYLKVDVKQLPHSFVHGDLHVGNLIKGRQGEVWVLDFAVSNYYPRITELAVLSMGGLAKENIPVAVEEYRKIISLEEKELEALPTFTKASHAMYVLICTWHKKANQVKTKENEYWIRVGREGLRRRE